MNTETLNRDKVIIRTSIIGIITNTLSAFSVKELSEEELKEDASEEADDNKLTFVQTFKLLVSNKYFIMICAIYILQQLRAAMLSVGTYFMTYVLLNQKMFGVFSWAINIPLIIALAITPTLVAKMKGMYKVNKYSYIFATACRLGIVAAGYLGSIPLMFSCTSFGTKLGGGIGVALSGWLLDISGYINNGAVQPDSCISMMPS